MEEEKEREEEEKGKRRRGERKRRRREKKRGGYGKSESRWSITEMIEWKKITKEKKKTK